jgi:sugar phosphate isomerase/epimerase
MKGIGLQLYTLRAIISDDVPGTLKRVAEIGYDSVETAGDYGLGAAALGRLIRETGMSVAGAHIGITLLRTELDTQVRLVTEQGAEALICPIIPKGETRSSEQFRTIAAEFNRFAAAANDAGLRFLYHLHGGEFTAFEDAGDRTGFQILIEETDPDLVSFELDTYWVEKAGQESVALFTAHAGRIPYLHLKDYDKPATFRDVPVGEGTVNTGTLLAKATAAGVDWLVVEQEQFDQPEIESVATSYENIRGMLAGPAK